MIKSNFKWVVMLCATVIMLSVASSCEKEKLPEDKYPIAEKEYKGDTLKITSMIPMPEFWPMDIKSDSLKFYMSSLENRNVLFSFWISFKQLDDMLAYTIYINKETPKDNGEYRVVEIVDEFGNKHFRRFILEFEESVMVGAKNSEYKYNLKVKDTSAICGTESNPYLIQSVKDLIQFSNDLKNDKEGKGYGLYFHLNSDIDLNEYYQDPNRPMDQGWCGIGGEFSGKLNGLGHTISNFKYNSNGSEIGLFKSLTYGAELENFIMEGVDVSNAGKSVGAVAGEATGLVALRSITVNGNIRSNENQVGGLIGYSEGDLEISNCQVSGSISSKLDMIGGLVGFAKGEDLKISDCRVNSLYIESEGIQYAGGFVGSIATNNLTIKGCYASPNVTVAAIVGGLIGQVNENTKGNIENTRVDANIINAAKSNCGGIVGVNYGQLTFVKDTVYHSVDQQYDQDIIGNSSADDVGGFIGSSYGQVNIKESLFEAPVNGKDKVGGLIGEVYKGGSVNIEKTVISSDSKVNGASYVGGVIGLNDGNNLYIYYCDQYAKVTSSGDYCGLYIGKTTSTTLDDCYMGASVSGLGKYVGGIAGYATGLKITKLSANSAIEVSGGAVVGGIAGYLAESSFDASLITNNKKFAIKVSNTDNTVGGFAGEAENSTFKNITLHSSVIGKNKVGGFVGIANGGHYENCTIDGAKVSGTGNFTGGIIGRVIDKCNTLKYLTNKASVEGQNYTGGIFGELLDNSVSYCINEGSVYGAQEVGGIMGRITNVNNDSSIDISYCENNGSVSASERCLGGICGYVSSEKNGRCIVNFKYCFNNNLVDGVGTTNEGRDGMGGIVGEGKFSIRAANCANRGVVKGSTAYHHIGGIAGYLGENSKGYDNDLYIEQCYNSGTVEVTGQNNSVFVGGIAGHLEDAATTDRYVYIVDCYNIGTVKGRSSGQDNAGGMVGKASFYITMKNCYSAGMVYSDGNGTELSNGMAGTHADAEVLYGDRTNLYTQKNTGKDWWGSYFNADDKSKTSTYGGFDFNSSEPVWVINASENNGYPYLRNTPLQ